MSKYTITFEKAALKFLRKQDKVVQERIMKAIQQLPDGTDTKQIIIVCKNQERTLRQRCFS